ncbi:Cellulosome-anchoring protein precursor [Sporotomaculum syntrophicum]|uniref:Cellulosome-anchoring protein n=1 Tax=Sporotomaculum syntrophicum TaxID=182264 RepID=A0A9D2WPQ9_9FIRM|nr:S-layer homology domain-containing protein [Sporotomaculum syntrophicum]KAF1085305.1 Cellulosome-anchoring protein precursor [Sporotomaculum syntrophicum]
MRKTALIMFMSLCLLISLSGLCFAQPNDISGHWSEKQVLDWSNKGYINGYPDGSFKPNNPVSRAEFITFVNKAFNFTAAADPEFSDINSSSWYAGEVAKAVAAGYIGGYEDGTFKPNQQITRLEASSIIARVLGSKLSGKADALNGFRDQNQIPTWGRTAAEAVTAQGIIKGYADQTFRPGQPITRAEAIVVLDRAMAYEINSANNVNDQDTSKPTEDGTGGGDGNNPLNYIGALLVDTGKSIEGSTDVPVSPKIKLVFDRGVVRDYWDNNQNCITMESSSGNDVAINVTRISNNDAEKEHIYVTPKENLSGGKTYKLIISKDLKANNGNTLGKQVVISFQIKTSGTGSGGGSGSGGGTGGGGGNNPLNFIRALLVDTGKSIEGSTDVPVSPKIKLVFDRGVVRDYWDNNQNCITMESSTGNDVAINVSRISNNDAEKEHIYVTPKNDLTRGKTYKLIISKNLKANNGNTLGKQVVISFQVKASSSGGGNSGGSDEDKPTAPNLTDAQVTSQGDVNIVFNKAMADPSGKHAGFAVTVDGAPVEIEAATAVTDTKKIKLVLATKVTNGEQVVQVAYTKPGDAAQQIVAADGGVLESFAPQNVTNSLPGSAPTFVGADVTSQGDISVTFSQDMADPSGKHAGFVVTVDGAPVEIEAASAAKETKKIKLVLATKVTSGEQVVQVAYTKPGDAAQQIVATNGGVLESFAPQSVTNSLAVPPTKPAPQLLIAEVTPKGDISILFDVDMAVPAEDDPLMSQICDQFTVLVNGTENTVTAVSATNTVGKIKLVLNTKILTPGQSVTLSYLKSDNPNIQIKSTSGGVLESFADLPVAYKSAA